MTSKKNDKNQALPPIPASTLNSSKRFWQHSGSSIRWMPYAKETQTSEILDRFYFLK
jgi:hypothetical protein